MLKRFISVTYFNKYFDIFYCFLQPIDAISRYGVSERDTPQRDRRRDCLEVAE